MSAISGVIFRVEQTDFAYQTLSRTYCWKRETVQNLIRLPLLLLYHSSMVHMVMLWCTFYDQNGDLCPGPEVIKNIRAQLSWARKF